MARYTVFAVRLRTVNFVPEHTAHELRVAAESPQDAYAASPQDAYAAARDQMHAFGEDASGFEYFVKRRLIWSRPIRFPQARPRPRGHGGAAGVREPRRPRPSPPSLSAAVDEDRQSADT